MYASAILATLATFAAGASAAAVPQLYHLHVPNGPLNQSVHLEPSTSGNFQTILKPSTEGPGHSFYFDGGHLYGSNVDGAPIAITFTSIGDDYGHATPVIGLTGGEGRDDWEHGSNGGVGVPLEAALDNFYQCHTTIDGSDFSGLFYGTPYSNNLSYPLNCFNTASISAVPLQG